MVIINGEPPRSHFAGTDLQHATATASADQVGAPRPNAYNRAPTDLDPAKAEQPSKAGKWLMLACCVPMVAAGGWILWSMSPAAQWSERLFAVAPLAACIGAHLLMHKLMGGKCHSSDPTKSKENDNENRN